MLKMNRDLWLFLAASAFLGITTGIDSAFFNNYLSDTFHISVFQRTLLEIPREFPGFMVVLIAGSLIFLGDVRTACIANIFAAAGMVGLGFMSPTFGVMVGWMTLYSMGQHLYMPMASSIGMNLADGENFGKILGKINGLNTATFLLTSILIAGLFRVVKVPYSLAFGFSAVAFVMAAVMILLMKPHQGPKPKKAILIKKEFSLYYLLCVLFGARKQIFITFGPWVLIKIFHQSVSTFAIISFLTALSGIFFKPWLGHLIDRKGERFILCGEAILLVGVCGGYALAEVFFGKGTIALVIVAGCYIMDQLLAATSMARATYVKKTAKQHEDISPTLSMGISIDHSVSMLIPWIGGLVWDVYGYQYVFIGGAAIAVLNLLAARKISYEPVIQSNTP